MTQLWKIVMHFKRWFWLKTRSSEGEKPMWLRFVELHQNLSTGVLNAWQCYEPLQQPTEIPTLPEDAFFIHKFWLHFGGCDGNYTVFAAPGCIVGVLCTKVASEVDWSPLILNVHWHLIFGRVKNHNWAHPVRRPWGPHDHQILRDKGRFQSRHHIMSPTSLL